MASTRSKLANFFVRIVCKFVCKPDVTIADFRKMMVKSDHHKKGKIPKGLRLELTENPMPSRWLRNQVNDSGKVILYLHGGAFAMNMPETYTAMVSRLCLGAGASAYLPWYRLAPEYCFPAAPEDCLAAYEHLLKQFNPENIYIFGDSAGANLTLCLLNFIKQRNLPMPRAAVALSPITDFLQISSTWLMHSWIEPMFKVQALVAPQQHYLQGENLMNPLASPIYGDLEGLPPILLITGGVEALRDDSVGYVRKAMTAGVNAQVHIWEGMPHVHTLMDFLPESKMAETEIFKWIESLPPANEPVSQETVWRNAVTLFNRKPIIGHLSKITNGEQVYNRKLTE